MMKKRRASAENYTGTDLESVIAKLDSIHLQNEYIASHLHTMLHNNNPACTEKEKEDKAKDNFYNEKKKDPEFRKEAKEKHKGKGHYMKKEALYIFEHVLSDEEKQKYVPSTTTSTA